MTDQDKPMATRERILETVDRLFYRNGLQAVGVDAIVAELGISKKTLYRHFPSKDDLIVAYLKGRFRPLPQPSSRPPAEQILKNFEWFARSLSMAGDYRGCAYLNALAELGDEQAEARKLAVEFKESRRLWYRELLSRLEIDDPDTLATQLALLIDGAYAAALVRRDLSVGWAAVAAARVLLKSAGVRIAAERASPPGPPAAERRRPMAES
jgi:AcrR family transcriptional regulator